MRKQHKSLVESLNSQVDKLLQLGPQEASYDSWSPLLKRCWHPGELPAGKLVHRLIVTRFGSGRDFTLSSNYLIRMYGRCGRLVEAQLAFDVLPEPNVFSWTILFSAYAQNGEVNRARVVFEGMNFRDPVAWNAMISVYAGCGMEDRALEVFWRMNSEGVRWTETTLLSIVSCLAARRQPGLEEELAERSSTWSISLSNAMITMHSKRGSLCESVRIFECMRGRDLITWSAIMAGMIHNGCCHQALSIFRSMLLEGVRLDSVTLLMLLEACSDLDDGKLFHQMSISSGALGDDRRVSTALISMYGRCGDVSAAKQVFDELQDDDAHDVVSCSAMITAYVRNDMHEAAVELFRSIELEGVVKPNEITLSAALSACAELRNLHLGELLVDELETMSSGMSCSSNSIIDVSGVVIDLYCKCGRTEKAKAVFRRASRRSPVCWNSMVSGLALDGNEDEAVSLWREMELEGVGADKNTFVTIFSLWSHSGKLSDAAGCLLRLEDDHGLSPTVQHYGCIVDLLGRLGLVEEAELMVREAERKKTKNSGEVLWLTLLGACSTQLDAERGAHAAWQISQVNSGKAALYQLLFNIHACGED